MTFRVYLTNVTRDFYQGKLANRPALSNPENRKSNRIWDNLVITDRGSETIVEFDIIETGGAEPQVLEVYEDIDYTEDLRILQQDAPHSGQRPLMRGENGHGLQPNSPLEIKALVKQNIRDGASRIKVFDSQGDLRKIQSTIEGVVESRKEGYHSQVEIAIPYGNGLAGDHLRDPAYKGLDAYPDAFYLKKIEEAIEVSKQSGLDDKDLVISLKCMVGDMDAATAERLTRKTIELLRDKGSNARFGLHLHDTGWSKDAYVAAIEAAHKADWPIIVDTAEGTNTGFVSALDLDEALRIKGIDLGLTDSDKDQLKEIRANNDKVAEEYNVVKVSGALSGEHLRAYGIPGGGESAFEIGVATTNMSTDPKKQISLATALNISDEEALHVAGMGLIAVRQISGWPFGVTPGFANTQEAALHLLKKMIEHKHLTPDMDFKDIYAKVTKKLSDEQIKEFFLTGLPAKMSGFIKNNKMPVEHGLTDPALDIPATVRAALPQNAKIAVPSDDRYYRFRTNVQELLHEGLLKPTITQAVRTLNRMERDGFIPSADAKQKILDRLQAGNIVYARADGKVSPWHTDAGKIITALAQEGLIVNKGSESSVARLIGDLEGEAVRSSICRQIVLDESNPLRDRLKKPWMGEPRHALFQNNLPEYLRATQTIKAGFNAQADHDMAEILRQHLYAGNVDIDTAFELASKMIEKEWHEIRLETITYMAAHYDDVLAAVESAAHGGKASSEAIVKQLSKLQQKAVEAEKEIHGRKFFYSLEQRQAITGDFFRQEIEKLAGTLGRDDLQDIVENAGQSAEDAGAVKSHMTGKVWKVLVEPGQTVKKGDDLVIVEAMKMEHAIKAHMDGVIKSLHIAEAEACKSGDKVVSFDTGEIKLNVIQQRLIDLSDAKKASLESVNAHLDQNAPKTAIGYSIPANTNVRQPQPDNPYVELVINRAGCAAKIEGDLKEHGLDPIIIYTQADKDTPVIRDAAKGAKRRVRSYTDHEEIIKTIRAVMAENPGKTIRIQPGWGFVSEDHAFVAKLEEQLKSEPVLFMGPSSMAMLMAGDKRRLREEAKEAAPQYNVKFFQNKGSIDELRSYVESGFDSSHPLNAAYRADFVSVMDQGMIGDVIIKAVAGGGGKGIEFFKYDGGHPEDNFRRYVQMVLKNREYAHKNYGGNSTVLTERFIRGNAHHVEVQLAATAGHSMVLGYRDCTLQQGQQKIAEMNIIKGDYSPSLMAKIREAGDLMARHLAKKGYEGLGTLEMLVLPETEEVFFLEVNTRLQVEHGVTEGDIELKTSKKLPLPVFLAYLRTNPDGLTPQEIAEKYFDLTQEDQEAILQPGDVRFGQYRLTAKNVDVDRGNKVKPTNYADTMWPASIAEALRELYGVKIIHGGKGAGNTDSQFGAILGTKVQFDKAVPRLIRFFRLSALFERETEPVTGLGNARDLVRKILFTKDGNIHPAVSVNTVDNLLDHVQSGRVKNLVKRPNLADSFHWPDERAVTLDLNVMSL